MSEISKEFNTEKDAKSFIKELPIGTLIRCYRSRLNNKWTVHIFYITR